MGERSPDVVTAPPGRARVRASAVEIRSIDYVPLAERHGKLWHQGTFWFMGNANLLTLLAGTVGVASGLALGWGLLAIAVGVCFGTFFMAFHGVQGPRMGLPQMIQSRPQFGFVGAIFPWLVVVFVYVGFNVFDTILGSEGLRSLIHGNRYAWYVLITAVAALVAIFGYDMLHLVQRWLTYTFFVLFGIFTVGALATQHASLRAGGFSWPPFLLQLGAAASYQISYAPYVSDYSRYLPERVPPHATFWWVYSGAALSAIWLMALGAFLTAAKASSDAIVAIRTVGDAIFGGFGVILLLQAIPALVAVMGVNMYGAMLTGVSCVDSVRPVKPSRNVRVAGILAIAAIGFIVTLAIPGHYLSSFNNFLLLMLYFLVPWTAVNLVDYYFVRHGRYAITEIFNPRGMYHRWAWRGLTAYFVGFAAMIPFFSTTIFTGPIATKLGGGDISFLVGLPVAAGVYYLLSRSLDVDAEQPAVQESRAQLEHEAPPQPSV